jgi:hypothetical protein
MFAIIRGRILWVYLSIGAGKGLRIKPHQTILWSVVYALIFVWMLYGYYHGTFPAKHP